MTPEERDRLRTIEVQFESMKASLSSIDHKLEELRVAAQMGKGAWMLLLKQGTFLVSILAIVAWFFEKLVGKHL